METATRDIQPPEHPDFEEVPTDEVVETKPDGTPVFGRRKLPVRTLSKRVASVGEFYHRADGSEVALTPDRLAEWYANFGLLKAKGITPFVPNHHHAGPARADDNNGRVVAMRLDGDDLYADFRLIGEKAIETALKNDVSVYVVRDPRHAYDPKPFVGESVSHITLTPNPALPNLGDWKRLAASGEAMAARVFEVALAGDKPAAAETAEPNPPARKPGPSKLAAMLGLPTGRFALALAGTFTESKHPRSHGKFARAIGAAMVASPGHDRPGRDPAAGFRQEDADHPAVRTVLERADRMSGHGGPSGPQVANLARSHYATDASARAAFGSREDFATAARRAHEQNAGVVKPDRSLAHRPTGSLVIEGRSILAMERRTPADWDRFKAIDAEVVVRGESPKEWWLTGDDRAKRRAYRAGQRQEPSWPEGTTAGGVALAADAALSGFRSKLAALVAA